MSVFRARFLGRLFAAFVLLAGPGASAADSPVETVTDGAGRAFAPYMTENVDGARGIYADIVQEADRRMPGFKFDLKVVPWSRALFMVRTGRVNALVGTYEVPAERPWLRRYSLALTYESLFVFCRKGVAKKTWGFPEDYAGLTFGNNTGFDTPGPDFFKMVADGRIFLNEEQTTALNLRLLQFGRIDCYVQDKTVVDPILSQTDHSEIEPVKQLTYRSVHIGLSRNWNTEVADRFIEDLDRVLLE